MGKKEICTDKSQGRINALVEQTGFPKIFSSENSELARIPYSSVRKNMSFTRTFTGNRRFNKENY